jgi:hypothetical protein
MGHMHALCNESTLFCMKFSVQMNGNACVLRRAHSDDSALLFARLSVIGVEPINDDHHHQLEFVAYSSGKSTGCMRFRILSQRRRPRRYRSAKFSPEDYEATSPPHTRTAATLLADGFHYVWPPTSQAENMKLPSNLVT